MSTPLDDITKGVMHRIAAERISMRPRAYFIAGSVLATLGLTLAFVSSTLLLSILHLSLREGGRRLEYRLETLQEMFHWWIPVLALVSLGIGVWLLRRYEFSYKQNFVYVALVFGVAVLAATSLLVVTGVHEALVQRGPMSELVKPWRDEGRGYGQQRGMRDGGGRGVGDGQ